MITIKSKRDLENLPDDDSIEEVRLKTRVTKPMVLLLLNKFKNLKRIYNPSCYYKKTSKKILNALGKIGITVIETKKIGRKKRLDWEKVVNLFLSGKRISEIAKMFNVQRRSIYYILKKRGLK